MTDADETTVRRVPSLDPRNDADPGGSVTRLGEAIKQATIVEDKAVPQGAREDLWEAVDALERARERIEEGGSR